MTAHPAAEPADELLEGVILILTERCNSRCGMCDYWKADPPRTLSAGEIEDFWTRRVRRPPRFVTLSGGEPLLHPELDRLAAFLAARAGALVLSTNGLLLAGRAGPAAARFDKIIVSLDGASPSSYASVRGVDGFRAAIDSVKELKARRGQAKVILKITIQKANFRDLPDWFRLAAELGADGAALAVPDLASDAFLQAGADRTEPAGRVFLSDAEAGEFARVADRVLARYGDLLAAGFVVEGNLPAFVDYFRRIAASDAPVPAAPRVRDCRMARTRLVVNADGSIRPCFFLPPLGHIRDAGADDVFVSEPFRAFRRGFSSRSLRTCSSCYQFLDWRFL